MRKTNSHPPPKQADVIERKEVENRQQSSATDVHQVISSHQQVFGNEMVSLALQQTGEDHFHSMIEDDIQMNLAGIGTGPSVGPDASNQDMLLLMRRVSSGNASDATDAQTQVDKVLRGPGVPLPEAVRQKLESVFAKDLSAVRIHSNGSAAQAAMSVNAKAFAVGNDIVFGSGEFKPGTYAGNELLGHEITHVVQHLEGRTGKGSASVNGVSVTTPGDGVEREAEQLGKVFADQMSFNSADTALVDSSSLGLQSASEIAHAEGGTSASVVHRNLFETDDKSVKADGGVAAEAKLSGNIPKTAVKWALEVKVAKDATGIEVKTGDTSKGKFLSSKMGGEYEVGKGAKAKIENSLGKYEWNPNIQLVGPLKFDGVEASALTASLEKAKGKESAPNLKLVSMKMRFLGVDSKSVRQWLTEIGFLTGEEDPSLKFNARLTVEIKVDSKLAQAVLDHENALNDQKKRFDETESAKKKVDEADADLKKEKEKLAQADKELAEKQRELDDLKKQNDKVKSDIKQCQKDIEAAQKDIEETQRKIDQQIKDEQLEEKRAAAEKKKAKAHRKKTTANRQAEKIRELEEKRGGTRRARAKRKERIKNLRRSIGQQDGESLENALKRLDDAAAKTDAELLKAEKSLKDVRSKIDSKKAKKIGLNQQMSDLQSSKTSIQSRKNIVDLDVKMRKADVSKMKGVVSSKQKHLTGLQKAFDTKKEQLKKSMEKVGSTFEKLKERAPNLADGFKKKFARVMGPRMVKLVEFVGKKVLGKLLVVLEAVEIATMIYKIIKYRPDISLPSSWEEALDRLLSDFNPGKKDESANAEGEKPGGESNGGNQQGGPQGGPQGTAEGKTPGSDQGGKKGTPEGDGSGTGKNKGGSRSKPNPTTARVLEAIKGDKIKLTPEAIEELNRLLPETMNEEDVEKLIAILQKDGKKKVTTLSEVIQIVGVAYEKVQQSSDEKLNEEDSPADVDIDYEKAAQMNPMEQEILGWSPSLFGANSLPASKEFADTIKAYQVSQHISPTGIAGPVTTMRRLEMLGQADTEMYKKAQAELEKRQQAEQKETDSSDGKTKEDASKNSEEDAVKKGQGNNEPEKKPETPAQNPKGPTSLISSWSFAVTKTKGGTYVENTDKIADLTARDWVEFSANPGLKIRLHEVDVSIVDVENEKSKGKTQHIRLSAAVEVVDIPATAGDEYRWKVDDKIITESLSLMYEVKDDKATILGENPIVNALATYLYMQDKTLKVRKGVINSTRELQPHLKATITGLEVQKNADGSHDITLKFTPTEITVDPPPFIIEDGVVQYYKVGKPVETEFFYIPSE